MFYCVFVRILRSWHRRNNLVAMFIHSHGKHSETALLLDDTGSAYQIVVRGSGFYFRLNAVVTEYVPETKKILHQKDFSFLLPSMADNLSKALEISQNWMAENGGKRLSQDVEMNRVREMYEQSRLLQLPN